MDMDSSAGTGSGTERPRTAASGGYRLERWRALYRTGTRRKAECPVCRGSGDGQAYPLYTGRKEGGYGSCGGWGSGLYSPGQ